jgi:DNA-binding NarL/FixJ family response regulator
MSSSQDPLDEAIGEEQSPATIRVLIADDHPLFLKGLHYALEQHDRILIVGEANTAEDAVRLARRSSPDVAVVDLMLPEQGGLWVIDQIREFSPRCRSIILTASEDGNDLVAGLKAGAAGYLVKGANSREVIEAILSVYEGTPYVTPRLAGRVIHRLTQPTVAMAPVDELTERETQVLQLIAQGKTNYEIARALGLAEKTVKQYNTSIFRKLYVRSRVEAALFAHTHGLV